MITATIIASIISGTIAYFMGFKHGKQSEREQYLINYDDFVRYIDRYSPKAIDMCKIRTIVFGGIERNDNAEFQKGIDAKFD